MLPYFGTCFHHCHATGPHLSQTRCMGLRGLSRCSPRVLSPTHQRPLPQLNSGSHDSSCRPKNRGLCLVALRRSTIAVGEALPHCDDYVKVVTMKLFLIAGALALISAAHAQTIRLEAENGQIEKGEVQTETGGFSGRGYVGDFADDAARVTFKIPPVKAGIYRLRIRYSSPYGEKGFDFKVNGVGSSGQFEPSKPFTWHNAGKIELKATTNTISIERGWGYFMLDAIELSPAVNAPLKPVPTTLVDSSATPATRALYARLLRNYGSKTLSGQFDTPDTNYIRQQVGVLPSVYGTDLVEYSPSRREHGANPNGQTEAAIARIKKTGQILTLTWHWNAPSGLIDGTYTNDEGKAVEAPWWRGFDADATRFDLQKTLANPNGLDARLLRRDIDAIAVELKKYQDAGIPVLWRPLHEAPGAWFWWGAKGPESFKSLWRMMYERLTIRHRLHNLIWTWAGDAKASWYPGDSYVDIVGTDIYPEDSRDSLAGQFDALKAQYDGKKPIALCEVGGVPDIARMKRFGVSWLYFASWTDDLGPKKVPVAELKRRYTAPEVINIKPQ
ncbi:mannan endo-1,4-beta-mannosidase [bacterium]|nr:MAG: mannan endo-1,4-beta-mannosidase [bacterium]